MANREELKQQVEALQKQITELENAPKEWPSYGGAYYAVGTFGNIQRFTWSSVVEDKDALAIGNVFRTEAEAQSEIESRKVLAELRRQPGRKKFAVGEKNFCVMVEYKNSAAGTTHWSQIDQGWQSIYFNPEEAVTNAINAVGEERIVKAAKWFAMREVWR